MSNQYQRQFLVGHTYLTQAGKKVKIIAENGIPGCGEWVQGDDGEDVYDDEEELVSIAAKQGWRYDREGDVGRVTGSPHDFSDPRNLVPGSEQNV